MSDTIKVLCVNNAYGTLAATATATTETLFLAGDQGDRFPTPVEDESMFYATLEDTDGNIEVVAVNRRVGSTFTVTRGQAGTAAKAWEIGTEISLRVTAELMEDKICRQEYTAEKNSKNTDITNVRNDIANLTDVKLNRTIHEDLQASIDATYAKYTAELATYS